MTISRSGAAHPAMKACHSEGKIYRPRRAGQMRHPARAIVYLEAAMPWAELALRLTNGQSCL